MTAALHHHGEEPDAAGYTLEELFHLSRSTILQQRVIALQTLANIIRQVRRRLDFLFKFRFFFRLIRAFTISIFNYR